MTSWFSKKKAPDNTVIIRHDAAERQFGFAGKDTAGFAQARQAAYERMYGKPESVSHEVLPQIPHIDVYTIKRILKRPGGNEEFYVLMTGGMSDLEMTVPRTAEAKDVARRVELIFYCSEPREEYIETLRWVAHFPHDSKSWLGHGHTMPNGTPPRAVLGKRQIRHSLLPSTNHHQGPETTFRALSRRSAGRIPLGCASHNRRVQFQVTEWI